MAGNREFLIRDGGGIYPADDVICLLAMCVCVWREKDLKIQ